MAFWRQVAPQLLEGVGVVCKELLLDYVHQRMVKPTAMPRPSSMETPIAPETCPYCAIAKHLAVMVSYVERAKRSVSFLAIYQQLALAEVRGAVDVAQGLRPDFDSRVARLGRQVIAIEIRLSRPLHAAELDVLARELWDAMNVAFDLAEKFNAGARRGDDLAEEMERRVKDMDSKIIEGEAREVG